MASKYSTKLDSSGTFQESRENIDRTIHEIVQSLNEKRVELFSQIEAYEEALKSERDEIVSDIGRLENLMQQTEGLAKNSLSDLQVKLNSDISIKIDNLKIELKQRPDLELKCDKSRILETIESMYVEKCEYCDSDGSVDSDASSEGSGKVRECEVEKVDDPPKGSKDKKSKRDKKEQRKKEKKERKEKKKQQKEKDIEERSDEKAEGEHRKEEGPKAIK